MIIYTLLVNNTKTRLTPQYSNSDCQGRKLHVKVSLCNIPSMYSQCCGVKHTDEITGQISYSTSTNLCNIYI